MAVLQIVRGGTEGQRFSLESPRTVVGRHPNCQVILDSGVVSRQHAQILESHGSYHIEDLRSRNGTFINEQQIDGRVELRDGDQIRLCDVVLRFIKSPTLYDRKLIDPPGVDVRQTIDAKAIDAFSSSVSLEESRIYALLGEPADEEDFDPEISTSIRRLSADTRAKATVDPSVKLKAVLAITQALSRELQVDAVLPKMLETLFNIFPQAEQGFVLLRDSDSTKLKVKASRTRGGLEAETVAVSMTVVRHALNTRESILSTNLPDDSRFKNSTALARMRIHSMMCVPMLSQDEEGLGVIQIVTRDAGRSFSEEDLDLLSTLASQASMAVENARLHEEQIARRALERDLEFATQVQLGFLPKSRPAVPGYSFGDYYEAALSVGGDYFDYLMLPGGRVAMTIGDVAGKGMPAALLMARLYSSSRFQLLTKESIEAAISGLNEEISSSGLGHRFITFLLMLLDPVKHELSLVNAGHLHPLLRKADGKVSTVGRDSSSLPLGIMPEMHYQSMTISIDPGDTIIAFTDGVTEAMNDDRAIYGAERLSKLYSETTGTLESVIQKIVTDVEAFTGEGDSRDDTCLIAFRRAES